jgi:hypothetical protein
MAQTEASSRLAMVQMLARSKPMIRQILNAGTQE